MLDQRVRRAHPLLLVGVCIFDSARARALQLSIYRSLPRSTRLAVATLEFKYSSGNLVYRSSIDPDILPLRSRSITRTRNQHQEKEGRREGASRIFFRILSVGWLSC